MVGTEERDYCVLEIRKRVKSVVVFFPFLVESKNYTHSLVSLFFSPHNNSDDFRKEKKDTVKSDGVTNSTLQKKLQEKSLTIGVEKRIRMVFCGVYVSHCLLMSVLKSKFLSCI